MISLLLSFIPGLGSVTKLIEAAFEFLKPLFKVLGEFFAWFIKEIVWEGLKDILDSLPTLLLVVMIGLGSWYYGNVYGPKRIAAEQEIGKLVKQVNHLKLKCGVRCGR